jgi:hypothetical protein
MAKKYEVIVHNKTPAQVGDLLTSVNRLDNPMLKIFGLASTSKLLVKLEDGGFRIQSRLFFQHMSPVYVLASTQAVDKGTQLKFRLGLSEEGRQSLCIFGLLYYCLALYATFSMLTSSSFYYEQNRWCLIVFPFLILVVLPAVLSLGFLVPQYLQRRELEKEAFGFLKNTFPGLKEVSEKSNGWRLPEFAEKQPVVGGAWLMKPTPWRERFVRHHSKLQAVTKAVSRVCDWFSNTLSCPEMETLDAPSVEMELAIPQSQLMFRLSRQQSDEGFALGVFDKRKFHIVFKNHQFVVRRKRLLTSPIAKLLLHFLDLETGQQLTGKTTPVLAGTHLKLTWSQHPVVSPSPLIIILPMLVLLASVEVGAIILFVAVLIYGLMITSRVQQKAEQYEILQFLCESVGECGNDANLLQKKPLVIPF